MSVKLALDAMGGDFAPSEIIKGAEIACLSDPGIEVQLIGEIAKTNKFLSTKASKQIKVIEAKEVIGMHESAAKAVKAKPDSSIVVGMKEVKEGRAQAFISAGNTGAVMTSALLYLGRIKGISRPAIAVVLPTSKRPVILIDAGANSDCKVNHLYQFALMGHAYSKNVFDVSNPLVGLLNIGSEKGKGDDFVNEAHDLLEQSNLNFYGNIEGRDVSKGITDVIVCDGFIGNIVLKTMEGLASVLFEDLKEIINSATRNKVGGFLLSPSLKKMRKRLDQDTYGGSLLLGVNNICVICHGSANSTAIANALAYAKIAVEHNVVEKIKRDLETNGQN
ncbi:MAG: phosphate acyltransferase PlsX [Actinobacteria bacterium]|nr:MAG: phosphate acyltransferase PlsX [Actinomycetota bacterium]